MVEYFSAAGSVKGLRVQVPLPQLKGEIDMYKELPKDPVITAEDIEKLLKHEYGGTTYYETPDTTSFELDYNAWVQLQDKVTELQLQVDRYRAALVKIAAEARVYGGIREIELLEQIAIDALEGK